MSSIREIALKLILEYEREGKFVNLSLSSHIADKLSREERAALTALLYTSVERKLTYDYYIGSLAGRSLDKIDDRVRGILRLGLCQIIDMDSVPDFAAVNETVKLCKNSGERSFVNGVLRSCVRNKGALPMPPREKNLARHLSVKYSFPQKTVKHFISLFGESDAEKILSRYNENLPTDVTVNTNKISVSDFLDKLISDGYKAEMLPYSDISVRIYGNVDPRRLFGFFDGLFFVQDAASAVCASALGAKEGDLVIDVCACPGGKSFASAILMRDRGRIESFDIHESKLSLIESGRERLGISSVTASVCDASIGREELFGKADRVICDVPCSGFGVVAKKPEIRYKDPEDARALPNIQYDILCMASRYLKKGGILVYSTCTILPEENEANIKRFLDEHKDFSTLPFSYGEFSAESGMVTLLPHIHGTDGFFICKLTRL